MFNQVGWAELTVLLLLALFVFGPERLPGLAAEAGKGLRTLRRYLRGMTDDLKTELGPELGDLDLASLHPKTFVQKHLFEDDDEPAVRDEPRQPAGPALREGEPAPWDPDAT